MTYTIEFTTAAARQVRKLPRAVQARLLDVMSRELTGAADAWRVRIGDYRIIYEIHDRELLVLVVRAGHRREVYG